MVVFHHKDADGIAAAAVIGFYRNLHLADAAADRPVEACQNIIYYGLDYGDPVPTTLPTQKDKVYIVDFSIPDAAMQLLLDRVGASNVVWIDHHVTSLALDYGVSLPGSRQTGKSGCRLTWEYLFGDRALPEALALIEDHDIWAHKLGAKTWDFHMGLESLSHAPQEDLWKLLLQYEDVAKSNSALVGRICDRGTVVKEYRKLLSETLCAYYGFETELDGHKVFVLSAGLKGSQTFGPRMLSYDILIVQIFCGDHWKVSMYNPDGKVDVSTICARFIGHDGKKGGGHPGASGCTFAGSTAPFQKGLAVYSSKQ